MSCDFSACCIALCELAQIRESISKMEIIWVSIRNKQLDPPPPSPHWKKFDPHLEPRKMIGFFFKSNHWTSVKYVED